MAVAVERRESTQSVDQGQRLRLFCIFAVFIALAIGTVRTRTIVPNEGWFADPAFHLATKGFLGTTILETRGTWLEGIDRHTYWIEPLYPLTQAAVYRVFGFSLFATRATSVFWGVLALGAFFIVMRRETSAQIALLASLLLGTDFHFIVGGSVGRMDMMCAALGFSALAVYVSMRERSYRNAVVISQTLAAAACFTHPCGVLYTAALILLAVRRDRDRWNWRLAAVAMVPYAAGLAAYGAYILKDAPSFWRQMSGNVSGLAGEASGMTRFGGLKHPLTALGGEILDRYVSTFMGGSWHDPYRPQLLVLMLYFGGAIVVAIDRGIRRQAAARFLLSLAALFWVILWLFEGLKLRAYVVHTLPLFAGLAALWIWNWTRGRTLLRTAVVTGFLGVQALGIGYGFLANQYGNDFLGVVGFVNQHVSSNGLVMASGEFGFAYGFDGRIKDDVTLGYATGKRPQFYIAGPYYDDWIKRAETRDPAVYKQVRGLLLHQYREVYRDPEYTIYEQKPPDRD